MTHACVATMHLCVSRGGHRYTCIHQVASSHSQYHRLGFVMDRPSKKNACRQPWATSTCLEKCHCRRAARVARSWRDRNLCDSVHYKQRPSRGCRCSDYVWPNLRASGHGWSVLRVCTTIGGARVLGSHERWLLKCLPRRAPGKSIFHRQALEHCIVH